jgi:ABC-2 type transport system permease protein
MYINPLTYGVDGLRGTLIGSAAAVFPLWLNFVVLVAMSLTLATLGAYFFSRMEAD